jgi:catechol 2,3-dioxygenase-like lactoylglutathione lyase family enzyme
MRFGHIELFVRDPLASLRFYERIPGCKLVEVQGGGASVWIAFGEIQVLLRRGNPQTASDKYQTAEAGIVLYTDNFDEETSTLLDRGLKFSGDDGSDREPTFTDLDGHWFQIVDPRDFM